MGEQRRDMGSRGGVYSSGRSQAALPEANISNLSSYPMVQFISVA
jgi:hypothetical protein